MDTQLSFMCDGRSPVTASCIVQIPGTIIIVIAVLSSSSSYACSMTTCNITGIGCTINDTIRHFAVVWRSARRCVQWINGIGEKQMSDIDAGIGNAHKLMLTLYIVIHPDGIISSIDRVGFSDRSAFL